MKKITKFKDIPQLTRAGSCNTNIPLTHMLKTISEWEQDEYYQLQLNPNFQRGHVWTEKMCIRDRNYGEQKEKRD